MMKKRALSKEAIRCMAELLNLSQDEAHIEDLYKYVNEHLPNPKTIQVLDLRCVEPALTYVPSKES